MRVNDKVLVENINDYFTHKCQMKMHVDLSII